MLVNAVSLVGFSIRATGSVVPAVMDEMPLPVPLLPETVVGATLGVRRVAPPRGADVVLTTGSR